MRQNFSVDKQITFNNSECLTKQYSVLISSIAPNFKGKRIIKSGDVFYKDQSNVARILKRVSPITNVTTGTTGSLVLKNASQVTIDDKIHLVFPGYILTFANGTGDRTLVLGDLSVTFAMDAVPATSISNLVTAYNLTNRARQGKDHSLTVLSPTQVLVTSKTPVIVAPTFAVATNITIGTVIPGTYFDALTADAIGTVTNVNLETNTVTYTSSVAFTDTNLGDLTLQITTADQAVKEVLGFSIKDIDITNIDTKVIPLLTSSNGVYKSRIAYFDQDLVYTFPKIEWI